MFALASAPAFATVVHTVTYSAPAEIFSQATSDPETSSPRTALTYELKQPSPELLFLSADSSNFIPETTFAGQGPLEYVGGFVAPSASANAGGAIGNTGLLALLGLSLTALTLPEFSEWTLMLGGFGALGLAGGRRRGAVAA